jgi:hypothetical protein
MPLVPFSGGQGTNCDKMVNAREADAFFRHRFDGVRVMTKWMKTGIAGLAVAGTLAVTAAPAEAQRYRYRDRDRNDRAALAIGAGIIGLGLAAGLSNRRYYDRGYYGGGYYGGGYYGAGYDPYYDRGYYRPRYRSHYRQRCRSRVVFDPYYGDYVRVRYC